MANSKQRKASSVFSGLGRGPEDCAGSARISQEADGESEPSAFADEGGADMDDYVPGLRIEVSVTVEMRSNISRAEGGCDACKHGQVLAVSLVSGQVVPLDNLLIVHPAAGVVTEGQQSAARRPRG